MNLFVYIYMYMIRIFLFNLFITYNIIPIENEYNDVSNENIYS